MYKTYKYHDYDNQHLYCHDFFFFGKDKMKKIITVKMFVDILYFVSKFQYFKEVITFNRKVVLLLLSRVRCLFI